MHTELKQSKAFIEQEVIKYYTQHKQAFETWNYGNIVKTWKDEQGNVCIEYDSGDWFHYNKKGEWW